MPELNDPATKSRGRRGKGMLALVPIAAMTLSMGVTLPAAAAETPSAESIIDVEAFASPPSKVRPMYRWWMPLAYTDDDALREQLNQIAESGAGGVEVAPFVVPGDGNQSNAFLAEYGWGTPAWAHKMEVITDEAAKLGLKVDQNLGPQYPPTVPSLNSFNQPEAEQQLIFGWSVHESGEDFSGALPQPQTAPPSVTTALANPVESGQRELSVESVGGFAVDDIITVGAGETEERVTVTGVGDRVTVPGTITTTPLTKNHAAGESVVVTAVSTRLRTVVAQCETDCTEDPVGLVADSVVDVTHLVDENELTYEFPDEGDKWVIIDFLQTASGNIAQRGGYSETQPNYVVDHLSRGGVDIQADFWDENILTEAVQTNLDKVGGGAIFEDSLELGDKQKWTWDFLDEFQSRRGYDATQILPALAGIGIQGAGAGAFDLGEVGAKAREDYRQTVSDLFIDEYVANMQAWAQSHGLDFRVQAYGLPISTSAASAAAGIPEGESLNFGSPNPLGAEQDYRVLSGGAHLSGKEIVSVECCAVFSGGYRSSMAGPNIGGQFSDSDDGSELGGQRSQGLLDSIYKSYAGGVNQLVWHGFAYPDAPAGVGTSGRDGGTWPGYQPWDIFGALNVNDVFGPRQANWEDMKQVNDALGRMQYVLRQGQAKLDLGVYYEDLGLLGSSVSHQQPEQHMLGTASATSSAGYTYEYVAPDFLAEDGLTPDDDGGLFADRSGYKAIVLNNQRTISLDGARSLLNLAEQGLRVYVLGDVPSEVTGADPRAEELTSVVEELLAQPSVQRVEHEGELPGALRANGIAPAVTSTDDASGLGFVRREAENVTYDFVYNRSAEPVVQELTLSGTGRPYALDPWSGKVEPVGEFTSDGNSVTVPLDIAPYDVRILALVDEEGPTIHAVASDSQVIAPPSDGDVVVRATSNGVHVTDLSDGTSVSSDVRDLVSPFGLTSWTLKPQTWGPAEDAVGLNASRTEKVDEDSIELVADADGRLPSWLEISSPVNLTQASGLGQYSATVSLPDTWQSNDGAYLDLGAVLDTVQVRVNGQQVVINQADRSRIDLGHHLEPGDNLIEVRVATTMFNAVRATGDSNYQMGQPQRTGLVGPITLSPYRDILVHEAATDSDTEAPGDGVPGGSGDDTGGDADGPAGGADNGDLATTGGTVAIGVLVLGALLLAGGYVLVRVRRRATAVEDDGMA